jgi:signal transduction histidine kinase
MILFPGFQYQNYEGYGIGLPLARNIVRMHHGELIVSSHENQGTTVQLRFPNFYSMQTNGKEMLRL